VGGSASWISQSSGFYWTMDRNVFIRKRRTCTEVEKTTKRQARMKYTTSTITRSPQTQATPVSIWMRRHSEQALKTSLRWAVLWREQNELHVAWTDVEPRTSNRWRFCSCFLCLCRNESSSEQQQLVNDEMALSGLDRRNQHSLWRVKILWRPGEATKPLGQAGHLQAHQAPLAPQAHCPHPKRHSRLRVSAVHFAVCWSGSEEIQTMDEPPQDSLTMFEVLPKNQLRVFWDVFLRMQHVSVCDK